jgi:uncharacterized protein (TIGR02145 family)
MQKQNILAPAVYILMIALMPTLLGAQILFGNGIPDGSAALDVQSNGGGTLFPRLTTAQRDGISSPATGLMLYNTSSRCLEVNVGTPASVEWARLNCLPGSIATLDCAGATVSGSLILNQAASGVSASVPYTGGNEGVHTGQTVTSTGVTGLTATVAAGSFASGAGNLTYDITGTPASGGTATFALNIGGQACNLNVPVSYVCKAKIDATTYRDFMCHNLGAANTSADPFTPSWEINGGYWQWGRPTEAAAGPTGPGTGDTNEGAISGWNNTNAANGSWDDGSKTANDPCPTGYRVPTTAQWDGVLAQNTKTNVGTFSKSATNYGAGKKFGDNLMLPAAGFRDNVNGTLVVRGSTGYYFSSTELSTNFAFHLYFDGGGAYKNGNYRSNGLSVRCIAE